MRLLIVDDDENQLERYRDSIAEFSLQQNIEIRAEYQNNLEDGLQSLAEDFDGAVVDLKLSATAHVATGNVIIKQIKNSKRFPVCVLTGYPDDLDEDLQEELSKGPNLFFWLVKRDRQFSEVLNRLTMVYQSGVVEIVGPHGLIEEALHTIFWTHLAKTLSFWNKQTESNENRKQRLVRFILSHLLLKLEINEGGDLDDSYPDEMYVIPPFRDEWGTGDIATRAQDSSYFVILTPACDLAQGKAKSIQIVEVESFESGIMLSEVNCYKALSKKLSQGGREKEIVDRDVEKQATALDNLIKLAGNSYSNRYHFLPSCQNFPGGLLNFQKVNSLPFAEFSGGFKKHGTITSVFLKDIVSRFAGYYARQGQPGFESERLVQDLIKLVGK